MRAIPADKVVEYSLGVLVTIVLAVVLRFIPRWRSPPIWIHPIFVVLCIASTFVLPEWLQDDIFSPGGVLLIGTVLPVYSSIVAVCSVSSDDDARWLQFWMCWATLSFGTEFMDDITARLPHAGEHWFEFEFFVVLWLVFPFTNGSEVLYNTITKPFITPIASKLCTVFSGWASIVLTGVNASYCWILWFSFVSLPEESRRFLTIALGTAYPLAASIVAMANPQKKVESKHSEYSDFAITQWLTYWSCYMVLFVALDYLENFVGHIRGFYSICCAATLYLCLPMLDGATVVFRRILVPLTGQYENMLIRDAWMVRNQIVSAIPEKHKATVLGKAAAVFVRNDDDVGKKK